MDTNLSMERQVINVKRRCGMLLKNLWQVNRSLDTSTKILLVKQQIISRLDYCNILFTGLPRRLLDSLQKTLNSCVTSVRFIYNLYGHQDDYSQYLKDTHILPVAHRVDFKACLMAFKIVHNLAPDYLCEQVPVEELEAVRTTRGTLLPDPYKLKYPKLSRVNANSKLRRRRLSFFLPEVWNKLSRELRSVESVDLFKTKLKTRLFVEAFGAG